MSGSVTSRDMAVGWNSRAKGKSIRAAKSNQHLKPVVARKIAKDARVMHVIFNNQKNGVAFLQDRAIVFEWGSISGSLATRLEMGSASVGR